MDGWLVTIVGGIVVVLVGLGVEYGIIQRKRKKKVPTLYADKGIGESLYLTGDELPWSEAINKGLAEFKEIHPNRSIKVLETSTSGIVGYLRLEVATSKIKPDWYSLQVRKDGVVTEIKKLS